MLYFLCYCSCFKVLIPMRNLTFVRRYTARHRWARRHPVTSWTFSEPSALPTKMCSEGNVLRRSYLTLTWDDSVRSPVAGARLQNTL